MCDVEPKSGTERILLVLSAEHTLRDVSTTAGLRSRIPRQPPLHSQINHESQDWQSPNRIVEPAVTEVRKESGWIRGRNPSGLHIASNCLEMRLKRVHASDLCHRDPRQHDDHGHLQGELEKVCDQNS